MNAPHTGLEPDSQAPAPSSTTLQAPELSGQWADQRTDQRATQQPAENLWYRHAPDPMDTALDFAIPKAATTELHGGDRSESGHEAPSGDTETNAAVDAPDGSQTFGQYLTEQDDQLNAEPDDVEHREDPNLDQPSPDQTVSVQANHQQDLLEELEDGGDFEDGGYDLGPAGPDFGETVEGRDGYQIKASTAEQYAVRTQTLWRATRDKVGADSEASVLIKPIDVVNYLLSRRADRNDKPRLRMHSWNGYRSALLWSFSQHPTITEYREALLTLEEARYEIYPLDPDDGENKRVGQPKQKESRSKGIPLEDFRLLMQDLCQVSRRGVGWNLRTQYWLHAGKATGLRIGEWEHARWDDEKTMIWLLAPISKEKADTAPIARGRQKAQQQPTLEPRKLKMRAIPVKSDDRLWINAHLRSIAAAKAEGIGFKQYHERCRVTLWRACVRIWGGTKLYSLYDTRHQFAANKKKTSTREEVAAAMGHSIRASRMYASQRFADKRHSGRTDVTRHNEANPMAEPVETKADFQDLGEILITPQSH